MKERKDVGILTNFLTPIFFGNGRAGRLSSFKCERLINMVFFLLDEILVSIHLCSFLGGKVVFRI
jgi:hypothetical protein